VSEHLHHKLAVLRQSLLHGKLPRNLHWNDALELIRHVGEVQNTAGDEFAFVVGGQREFFKRPHTSELAVEEVSRLRRFLSRVESAAPAADTTRPGRMVVVIDHHAAHVFRDLGGSRPRDAATIEPYDPYHFHRHLIHRKEAHYRGDRAPEEFSFYEEVSQALVPAAEIILIGHATGKSSAVDALLAHLKKHRPDVAARVLATETVDLSALTEPGIEVIAKRHLGALTRQ
jgi:hypothetical protein